MFFSNVAPGVKTGPILGVTSWNSRNNKKVKINFVGKMTQVSNPGSSWPSCHSWILSSAYLQNYTSYSYEILWVDRSHQGGVQCTWTLILGCLIFELLPFVYFHTWILSGAYLQNCTSYGYEISWLVTTLGKTGLSCNNLSLLFSIHAIIFSDKSRTMDLIFRCLCWFSGSGTVYNTPPSQTFFFFTPPFPFFKI